MRRIGDTISQHIKFVIYGSRDRITAAAAAIAAIAAACVTIAVSLLCAAPVSSTAAALPLVSQIHAHKHNAQWKKQKKNRKK